MRKKNDIIANLSERVPWIRVLCSQSLQWVLAVMIFKRNEQSSKDGKGCKDSVKCWALAAIFHELVLHTLHFKILKSVKYFTLSFFHTFVFKIPSLVTKKL